jgi:PEGA domain
MNYKSSALFALLLLWNCATVPPKDPLRVPSPTEEAIRAWQTENDIELSEPAFQLLVAQVESPCSSCSETWHFKSGEHGIFVQDINYSQTQGGKWSHGQGAQGLPEAIKTSTSYFNSNGSMSQILHDYYLDQLRDLNIKNGKPGPITDRDIKAYPFAAFLKDIEKTTLGPMGRLIVLSSPKLAPIRINGKRKGYTNKRFVVGAGEYEIQIEQPLGCRTNVAVGEFETWFVACPLQPIH